MKHLRHQKFHFRNGKTAANRVVVPPMASQTANLRGFATESTFHHYERLAASGAGILFVEYTYVHQTGKGEPNQLAADHDEKIPGLTRIARLIQAGGSLAGLQLVHVGGKTSSTLTGAPLLGASAVAVPVKGREMEIPRALEDSDIPALIEWYVTAAKRAEQAGFDFVELHAAHGYGLNQWLSPITNHRTDRYGGGMEGRGRLLLEIVNRIKRENPTLLLSVRMPAQDHFPGGLEIADTANLAQRLEAAGVDLIDVSSGIGGWRRTDSRNTEGYLVADAAALKAHVNLPVIGVGGIETSDFIEVILGEKKVDFAAVGRAILNAPRTWNHMNLNSSPTPARY